jgi:hypothetical protein
VIGWQLLRHAEILAPQLENDPFARGKLASARYFLTETAPQVAARRASAEREDGSLMELPVEAF